YITYMSKGLILRQAPRRVRKGAFSNSRTASMTNRKYRVLTVGVGILLQLVWLYFLVSYTRGVFRWYGDWTNRTILSVGLSPPEADLLYRIWTHGRGIYFAATVLWGLFVCVLATKGLLTLRPLGRKLAVLISIDMLVIYLVSSWIAGSYPSALFWAVIWAIFSALVIWFSSRRRTRAQFQTDLARASSRTRLLVEFYVLFLVLKVLLVPSFIAFLSIKLPEQLRMARLVPERAEYVVSDSTYLKTQCKQQEVFGYSIWLPDYMKVLGAFYDKNPPEWSLWLRGIDGRGNRVMIVITDEGRGGYLFPFMDSEHRRFKSPYELERVLNYPSWSPNWMMLKLTALSVPPGVVKVEDATSSSWKGFVMFGPWTDGVHNTIVSSMYDSTGEHSVQIMTTFNQKSLTVDQVRSILASLKFETVQDDTNSVRRGLAELETRQYRDASISFLNALYLDPQNPRYAYYFAQSLLEDTSKAYRKRYLKLSKKFLEYSLGLDSSFVEAGGLLPKVNDELARVEAEESEDSSSAPQARQPANRDQNELEK
ncbi:MAG: hypothetical protein ACE5JA_03300, partial [bacterium]